VSEISSTYRGREEVVDKSNNGELEGDELTKEGSGSEEGEVGGKVLSRGFALCSMASNGDCKRPKKRKRVKNEAQEKERRKATETGCQR